VLNSLASVAVGHELGIDLEVIRTSLAGLEGVRRRLEIKGEKAGVTVIDDYAHHPTEIKTTLESVKESWQGRRKVIVFQPHRYTRTQALFDDFTRAFYQTDVLVLLPIYAASEDPIPEVNHHLLCEGIRAHGHKQVLCARDAEDALERLAGLVRAGDIVLTLGAGDVWKLGERLLGRLP
jgi:UDP-N-acetylmuramate--alanine ligase